MIVLLKEGYYMRKLFAFLALFAVVLTLSACTTKVAGKTFVYEELEISFTEKGDENTNAKIQQYLEALYTGKEITFNEDGTCTPDITQTRHPQRKYRQGSIMVISR